MTPSQHHTPSRLTSKQRSSEVKITGILLLIAVGILGNDMSARASQIPKTTETASTMTPNAGTRIFSNTPTVGHLNDTSYSKMKYSTVNNKKELSTYSPSNRSDYTWDEKLTNPTISTEINECYELFIKLNISDKNHFPTSPIMVSRDNILYSFVNVTLIIEEDFECTKLPTSNNGYIVVTCAIQIKFLGPLLNDNIVETKLSNALMSLSNNKHIKAMSFQDNKIPNLESNIFDNFTSLEILDLSNNDLRDFNFWERSLWNLKKLRMSSNKLNLIKGGLINLTSLFLDRNYLTDISFLSNFQSLSNIDISNNLIIEIQHDIFKHLQKLRCLFLQGNKIKDVEFLPHITNKNIYRLKLSHNFIEVVNVSVTNPNLQVLELNNNKISHFNFSGLTKFLLHLNLCNNKISRVFPVHAIGEHYIQTLYMCDNYIGSLGFIMKMKYLVTLSLNNNKLGDIEKMFINKETLRNLHLSNVTLKSLDFVKNLSLQSLYVDGNSLKRIPKYVFEIETLEELGISNNPLENLYCSKSKKIYALLQTCDIPITEEINKLVLDLWMRNETINRNMKCLLNSKDGKIFLNSCTHNARSAGKSFILMFPISFTRLFLILILILQLINYHVQYH